MNPELQMKLSKKDIAHLAKIMSGISVKDKGRAIVRGITESALDVEAGIKKASTTGSPLKSRTGRLSNSIGSKVEFKPGKIIATIGSGVRRGKRVTYANILETGGTIRPKNAKFLTVPLKAAKTASGVSRGSARDFSNTFVRKTGSGELIIFQSKGKGESIPLFVLKKSVKIPATKYMSKTATAKRTRIASIMLRAIEREIKR